MNSPIFLPLSFPDSLCLLHFSIMNAAEASLCSVILVYGGEIVVMNNFAASGLIKDYNREHLNGDEEAERWRKTKKVCLQVSLQSPWRKPFTDKIIQFSSIFLWDVKPQHWNIPATITFLMSENQLWFCKFCTTFMARIHHFSSVESM